MKRFSLGRIGFTCSQFDLLHAGHCILLKDAKDHCNYLIVGLQTDSTFNRPNSKNKPIETLEERYEKLSAIKYVDEIVVYENEDDLHDLLEQIRPDVLIMGSDWKGKNYTGIDLNIPAIHFHDRTKHNYSTTSLRRRVYKAEITRSYQDDGIEFKDYTDMETDPADKNALLMKTEEDILQQGD